MITTEVLLTSCTVSSQPSIVGVLLRESVLSQGEVSLGLQEGPGERGSCIVSKLYVDSDGEDGPAASVTALVSCFDKNTIY